MIAANGVCVNILPAGGGEWPLSPLIVMCCLVGVTGVLGVLVAVTIWLSSCTNLCVIM